MAIKICEHWAGWVDTRWSVRRNDGRNGRIDLQKVRFRVALACCRFWDEWLGKQRFIWAERFSKKEPSFVMRDQSSFRKLLSQLVCSKSLRRLNRRCPFQPSSLIKPVTDRFLANAIPDVLPAIASRDTTYFRENDLAFKTSRIWILNHAIRWRLKRRSRMSTTGRFYWLLPQTFFSWSQ